MTIADKENRAGSRRLRVIAVAAACHPNWGSEPGLGWGWIRALARRHDVWAIVGERDGNRAAVDRVLDADPELRQHLRVHYIERGIPTRLECRLPPLYYKRYAQWHWRAYELARQLTEESAFDLVHQVNMIGYREPGYLWRLDLPFVWGPIDGATNMPLRFWRFLGARGIAYYLAYNMVNTWQLHFKGRVRSAMRRADGLVVASEGMGARLAEVYKTPSALIHDTGPVEAAPAMPISRGNGEPLRLVWSGIHVARKALPILLHALSKLPRDLCRVEILGTGPCTASWQHLARRLGIADCCVWHGRVGHDQALNIMRAAHVFALTSLRDATSTVLMEALSFGLPVICLNHCGFSDVVNESCGVKILLDPARQVAERFAEAIHRLACDAEALHRVSAGAINRAAEFSWDAHAEQMTRVYHSAIARWRSHRDVAKVSPFAVNDAFNVGSPERSGCYEL